MAVETIELTGDALAGDVPTLHPAALMASLPRTVCLGRRRLAALPQALKLGSYFNDAATPPPASVDYYTKAAPSIARMYMNSSLGDCVIAGKGHCFGVWSANDSDSGGVILGTDTEIVNQYHKWCGAGDNGCNITDVLDAIKAHGMVLGGKTYKIDGYVAVDWTNKTLVQAAIYLFGATTIGINLPSAWTSAAVWDVTTSRIVGGHDVSCVGFSDKGVQVSSWGRIYTITWAAFLQKKWVEEHWVMLAPAWYNSDKLAPSGVNVTALQDDLQKLSGGVVPDITPPGPTPTGVGAITVNQTITLPPGQYNFVPATATDPDISQL